MKSRARKKRGEHALLVEWGGLTAGAYGRPAVFALLAGGTAAWYVVSRVMKLPSAFLPEVAAATVIISLVLTVGFGLLGTWRLLGQKPARVLREL